MKLETERLLLYPIDDEAMRALVAEQTEPELKQAYAEMLDGCLREPEQRVWHAVWLMERKDRPGTIVGDLSFKGLNADGMVELGYGLHAGCCGRGYMAEAVRAICEWVLRQAGPEGVCAALGSLYFSGEVRAAVEAAEI